MKYTLYKFPNILHFTNEGKPYLLTSSKKPVKGELIAVEYGTDIMDAEESLMKAIVDDLTETYHCRVDATSPDEKMFSLQCLTDEHFDYEMTGIVYDYNKPKNLIVIFGVRASSEVSGS